MKSPTRRCKVQFIFLLLKTIIVHYPLSGEMTGFRIDDVCENDRRSKIKGIRTSDTGSKGKFQITLRNMGTDGAYDASFVRAKNRWEKVIMNDLPDVPAQRGIDWFNGVFGTGKAANYSIDDVLIGYSVTEIDGVPSNGSNILGQAMPLYVRLNSKPVSPTISGMMIFDKADFDSMNFVDVELIIAHEMGHVLGIGRHTFSWFCGSLCQTFAHSTYQCPRAQYEYRQYASSFHRAAGLPHQSLQLSLPDCGHWNESNFISKSSSELMTPVFEKGKYQPLSRVTVAALEDLGYTVNFDGADPWNKRSIVGQKNRRDKQADYALVFHNSSKLIISEDHELLYLNDQRPSVTRSLVATESFTLRHESRPKGDDLLKKFTQYSNSWIVLDRF